MSKHFDLVKAIELSNAGFTVGLSVAQPFSCTILCLDGFVFKIKVQNRTFFGDP